MNSNTKKCRALTIFFKEGNTPSKNIIAERIKETTQDGLVPPKLRGKCSVQLSKERLFHSLFWLRFLIFNEK